MSDFAARFWKLVEDRRQDLDMTYANLAVAALGDDGAGGEKKKSDVHKMIAEKRKPNARTQKRFADALDLTREDIDALKTADDLRLDAYAHRLFEAIREAVALTHISDDYALALSETFAGGNPGDFEAALAELRNALSVAERQAELGRLSSNIDEAVAQILAEVARLNDEESIAAGSAFLARALEEAREEAARADAKRRRLIDAGIAQAVLERSVAGAVALEIEKWQLDGGGFDALRDVQNEWLERGRNKGLRFDLEVSIQLAQFTQDCARNADERGAALNDLGLAQQTLGERQNGVLLLEQALVAYRSAVLQHCRDRVPINWAGIQNNLGNTLRALGARESGTARLEQAVEAFRCALLELPRDRNPLDWAMVQNNLGAALACLGERVRGTARLEQAVEAFRNALLERNRDQMPLEWAGTQNNLGAALRNLGERESGTGRLEEAVAAYRSALLERTRDRVPLDWAMTQNNLGTALSTLGQRESGTARLEEAVEAYRNALLERARDRVPLDWASTQNNLGNSLSILGEREPGTARLEQAIEAYCSALLERTRDLVPLEWARTSYILGYTEALLAERQSDFSLIEAGLARITTAMTVLDEGGHDIGVSYARITLERALAIQKRLSD